jgi:predicted glycogen debranching enzyme
MATHLDLTRKKELDELLNLEWLESNGIGGYTSGTVSGVNTRRYHGVLVAATHPPVGRMVVLSRLDECIHLNGNRYELGASQYSGDVIHPKGYEHLKSFDRLDFPQFTYHVNGVIIQKSIAAIYGENTTVILYEIIDAPSPFTMEFTPLGSCRDFHALSGTNDALHRKYVFHGDTLSFRNYDGCPEVFISIPHCAFNEEQHWYYNFEYTVEQQRGLDFREDLFSYGKLRVNVKKGIKFGVIVSTADPTGRDAVDLFSIEKQRRRELITHCSWSEELSRLVLAADQFIVKRGSNTTIVAGYHWFADWGRDTMIALPGLCLATGRYEEARQILIEFANSIDRGMLPNRFPDHGEQPEYNTIDATLWFFNAIHKYYAYTNDKLLITDLYPRLSEIIEWHVKGTRYGIHVDPSDNLISGGEPGVQLTWMDAKVGDWVVTPRKGKPVEINALWFNALCVMSELSSVLDLKEPARKYEAEADMVRRNFLNVFWNADRECLFDYVDDHEKNTDIRPNQLYAIGLQFPVLEGREAQAVLNIVREKLLTPRGLRSLSQEHPSYKRTYGGGVLERDGAYHQGTVWSFLLGVYVDALFRLEPKKAKAEASRIVAAMIQHLEEGCIGTISEIFNAEPPHTPQGCAAQAWSIGELLRIVVEHDLLMTPHKKNSRAVPQR